MFKHVFSITLLSLFLSMASYAEDSQKVSNNFVEGDIFDEEYINPKSPCLEDYAEHTLPLSLKLEQDIKKLAEQLAQKVLHIDVKIPLSKKVAAINAIYEANEDKLSGITIDFDGETSIFKLEELQAGKGFNDSTEILFLKGGTESTEKNIVVILSFKNIDGSYSEEEYSLGTDLKVRKKDGKIITNVNLVIKTKYLKPYVAELSSR